MRSPAPTRVFSHKLHRARDWLLQRPQDLAADERQFIQASADAEAARRRRLRFAAATAFIVITAADFSPDGSELAIGGPDGSIRLIQLQAGADAESAAERTLTGHASGVTSVAYSRDGSQLLTGGNDGIARLWSLADAREIARFDGNAAQVAAVGFQEDGGHIAVGYADGTARMFDVEKDPTVEWRQFGSGSARLSADGAYVAVLTKNSKILVYDTTTGSKIASIALTDTFRGDFAVSPGANSVALLTRDSIKIWNISDETERIVEGTSEVVEKAGVGLMGFSEDGTRLALGGGSRAWGFACIIDVATGEIVPIREGTGTGAVESVTFSKDGSRVLLRFTLSDPQWFDVGKASETAETDAQISEKDKNDFPLIGLKSAQTLALSRDGSRAVGAVNKDIYIWDLATGAQIAHFSGHEEWLCQVVFSPNDKQLVSISSDGTVGRWNLSRIPSGNVFDVVCALLPDHDLERALAGYPIQVDEPICAKGYAPPLPKWMNEITEQKSDSVGH